MWNAVHSKFTGNKRGNLNSNKIYLTTETPTFATHFTKACAETTCSFKLDKFKVVQKMSKKDTERERKKRGLGSRGQERELTIRMQY